MNANKQAYKILEGLKSYAVADYDVDGKHATVLDLGVNRTISDDSVGIKAVSAVLGGTASVSSRYKKLFVDIPGNVGFITIGSQLAGWGFKIGGKPAFGSGPARLAASKPKTFTLDLGYGEPAEYAAILIETPVLPDRATCSEVLEKTRAKNIMIGAFGGSSLVGLYNILGRVVEVAVFRLNFIGYDVNKIISAKGHVPIVRESEDANDAIIYGGHIEIDVKGWDESLTGKTVSKASKVYGRTYRKISEEVGGDFHRIDPDIFSPASLTIRDIATRKIYNAGGTNKEIMASIPLLR